MATVTPEVQQRVRDAAVRYSKSRGERGTSASKYRWAMNRIARAWQRRLSTRRVAQVRLID